MRFRTPSLFRSRPRGQGWLRDERGAAAIEFAFTAIPFFMLFMGIVGMGLYFFTVNALDHGVEAAARKIRTGQAQKGDMTVSAFRKLVCDEAGSYIDCGKLTVLVQNAASWGDLDPQSCITDSSMSQSTGESDDMIEEYSGGAKSVVLVTVCYNWELAKLFRDLDFGVAGNKDGAAVLQSSTAFRIEPYS
jgi:hypothetical protein